MFLRLSLLAGRGGVFTAFLISILFVILWLWKHENVSFYQAIFPFLFCFLAVQCTDALRLLYFEHTGTSYSGLVILWVALISIKVLTPQILFAGTMTIFLLFLILFYSASPSHAHHALFFSMLVLTIIFLIFLDVSIPVILLLALLSLIVFPSMKNIFMGLAGIGAGGLIMALFEFIAGKSLTLSAFPLHEANFRNFLIQERGWLIAVSALPLLPSLFSTKTRESSEKIPARRLMFFSRGGFLLSFAAIIGCWAGILSFYPLFLPAYIFFYGLQSTIMDMRNPSLLHGVLFDILCLPSGIYALV